LTVVPRYVSTLSEKDLGILADQAVVDAIEQALGAVAPAEAEDGGDVGIREHPVQIRQAFVLRARQVAATRPDVPAELVFEAERGEPRPDALQIPEIENVGGRRDQAHRIARLQGTRLRHRRRCRGHREGDLRRRREERASHGRAGRREKSASSGHGGRP